MGHPAFAAGTESGCESWRVVDSSNFLCTGVCCGTESGCESCRVVTTSNFLCAATKAGCPIQAVFWLEWDTQHSTSGGRWTESEQRGPTKHEFFCSLVSRAVKSYSYGPW